MKKCPACNSSKYEEIIVEGESIKSCKKCGFINKQNKDNNLNGQLSLEFKKYKN